MPTDESATDGPIRDGYRGHVGWVPVIDIGDAAAAVGEVRSACEDVGFLAIVGHGVPESVINETWAAARKFFDLALEAKTEVAMPRPGYPYGYSPISG